MHKIDIKNFTIEDLKKEIKKIPAPSYRAGQIFFWIYKKNICDFKDMVNIPVLLRKTLSDIYSIDRLKIRRHKKSKDGTEKFLFELSDGNFIESVVIFAYERKTLCLSTQVGCKYGCKFCASGKSGFVRNLTVSEIINQVIITREFTGSKITNFVFMGMGEPLDNIENLIRAIKIMNAPACLNIGARRITVSTCGLIPGIDMLKKIKPHINLSVSLHAADNKKRDFLVPVNKRYPLKELIKSCADFARYTKTKITIEYVLIKDINDSFQDADNLSDIAKRLKAKINLIPYSPVSSKDFQTPSVNSVALFKNRISCNGIGITVRESKGKDIDAACGQLAMVERHKKE